MYRNNADYPGLSKGYCYSRQSPVNQSKGNLNNYVKPTETNNDNNDTRLPPVITSPLYLQGYLRTKVGEFMRVNFLLGTNTFVDKDGILEQVGVDHIVLKDINTGEDVIADLYSIKFVEIPNEQ
ncbi:hypothetical protein HZI73_08845 [Vallitalea pronyensis]|uniref:Uncharacterized protein n=1 Tax=Vallitalea pronyensis TaxID=1348613 RepID=A0A8J8MJ09_9FIRM|nr:hypothetical protein [Vallitalea pronyensis]QUI22401.1 hypothetical protein HZI73_08845 [Vallitalea pronyensis]